MEGRRLDYYQPLLSVRRSPSPAPPEKNKSEKDDHSLPKIPTLPSYKSELKSGPIRNAGTVPFVWEQCPGKPKYESKSQNCTNQSTVITPKLPPGRIMEMRKQTFKYSSASKQHKKDPYGLHSISVSNENESIVEGTKDLLEIENSDTIEGNEEYLDALDTSPRTESFILNSSFSGISELDGSSVKTYGNFSIDPQTRDFMMDRFLPAAKAMTCEAPQYAPRKQPVVQEQLTRMVKVESSDKSPPLQYRPNVVPHYTCEEVEEESDDDYDDYGQLPAKACGLLPHLCLKSSFFPSNPLPGMRRRTRVQLSKTHRGSLYAASCCINENKGIKATVHRQRPIGDSQNSKHEDTIKSKNQSDQHNHFVRHKLEGSDLYRRVQGGGMLAHQNELIQSTSSAQKPLSSNDYELPRYTFSEQNGDFSNCKEVKNAGETGVSTTEKGFRTFKELLADTSSNEEVDIGSPMIEKTLHVDIIHQVESPSMYFYSPEMKGMPNLNTDILKDVEKCKTVESTHSVNYSDKDGENFVVKLKEDYIQVTAQRHVDDSSAASLAEGSNQVSTTKLLDSRQCRSPTKNLATTTNAEVLASLNKDSENLQSLNAEDARKPKKSYSMFSIPPPLPKSPSDSWLSRTLPSMASKPPSLQTHFGKTIHPCNHTSNNPSVDQKWETVVKSTRDNHRQEPLASIPEI